MNTLVRSQPTWPSVICTPPSTCGDGVVDSRYVNGAECVGYHADQLTYLGPHPTIASISLGCEREVLPT